ncbi:MAG TPA: phospholipase D family protein [Steroidobacteraceae bacterium]
MKAYFHSASRIARDSRRNPPPGREKRLGLNQGQSGAALMPDGGDAFAARVISAREAEYTIDAQYYIWHADTTGRFLAHELLAAADRGVYVRLLLDDMDARSRNPLLTTLNRHPRFEIRMFNPFPVRSSVLRTLVDVITRASRLNHRMHNKSWIVDNRVAMLGGRNVGDEYFAASAEVNFVDLDVLLTGAAVAEAATVFERYWNSDCSVPVEKLRRPLKRHRSLQRLREMLRADAEQTERSDYAERLRESSTLESLVQRDCISIWSDRIHVVADDPRKADDTHQQLDPGVLDSMIAAIGGTRRELLLVSPYFVPGAGATAALCDLAQRASVDVLTNSLAATDVAAVHSGYSRYRTTLLLGGVKLSELKPTALPEEGKHQRLRLGSSRASLHTKAAVVDGSRVFVGSFNLDPRSARLNCEMGAWIESEALAEQMRAMYVDAMGPQRSFVVTLDDRNRPQWMETVDGANVLYHQDPHASWGRRVVTWLLQFLPLESQL